MKKLLLILLTLPSILLAQTNLTVNVAGLQEGDTITVIAQQGVKYSFNLELSGSDENQVVFNNLPDGNWAVKIDAIGFSYEATQTILLPTHNVISFNLTPFEGDEYTYEWRDDDSYAGHAEQAYINQPLEITFLDNTITIPEDFSSLQLARDYGVILSNEKLNWTDEDAYKLLSTIQKLPFAKKGWKAVIDEGFSFVISLTEEHLENNIEISRIGAVQQVRISKEAFTGSVAKIQEGQYFIL